MRATILLPLISLALGVLANPPACLLGVVGQQDSPRDLSAICGSDAKDVQASLDKECSRDSKSDAQEAFISSCSAAGTSVAAYTPSSTASDSSATATGSGSSGDPTNTASSFGSGTGSSTASGTGAVSTGESGAGSHAVAGSLVMAAAAVAGLVIGL